MNINMNKMKNTFLVSVLLCLGFGSMAQTIPQVPSKMEFAGISLHIHRSAQKKIQESVDALRKSDTYFQKYVNRANLYFPIIEEVFRKEHFPDDIKYLILQESSINPNAVSSSNAVGYWQFKEASATEVGLRVDRNIDERKNIVASSKGAARYIKKNNLKLDNWVYAVIAYNVGPGGVQKFFSEKYKGAKKMDIDGSTHWYFLKLLAHIIAYQDEVGKEQHQKKLIVYTEGTGESIKKIKSIVKPIWR